MSQAKSPMPPTSKTPTAQAGKAHIIHPTSKPPAHQVSKTPVPQGSRTPTSKPGSRNGLPPAPQLTVIKYTIDIDVIKCPVCLEVFKSPRVISCGHSMCLQCLNSLILYTESAKTKDYFQCPVCHKNNKPRDTHTLRQKWANQFPVNATILRLLRNATIKNSSDNGMHKAFCEVCLVNNQTRPVSSYCNTCLEHQCDICTKYHEKREDARDHDVTTFIVKEEPTEKVEAVNKSDQHRKSRAPRSAHDDDDRRVKFDPYRESRLAPLNAAVVAQTVTAADGLAEKNIVKLGHFNGNAPTDSATSDFRAIAFITNNKIVLADHANKKLKLFDISHKTRVELITDLNIRADPSHMSRIDENTVAVVTERTGVFHIRLFTIRDKIFHFVHRTVDSVPLGLGYIENTVVCSFLGHQALVKYRLTRAQQRKVGVIAHDRSGNDMFHHPGAMCSGTWHGTPVIYVADETEYGVTVSAIDLHGDKKASVFFECAFPKPKQSKKSANGVLKSGRTNKTRSAKVAKKDDASDTTGESENARTNPTKSSPTRDVKQNARKSASQSKESPKERLSGRHTFRRVDDFGRVTVERREGREIERPPMPSALKSELSIDLNKIIKDDADLNETIGKSADRKSNRIESKAVERAHKKPVGKVQPQQNGSNSKTSDKGSNDNPESTINLNSTITSSSTVGTVTFSVPPKLVYRADSISVDQSGNIYVCMSSSNKIHQMSPDGRVKRDLLTEKDGLVAPKAVSFSQKSDLFIVTSLRSNKVLMFRLK